ncbi:trypsin-like peptidase domain-containing protein [Streptomyces sp. NPDC053048]|uniref:S1C family serine protease n=1 Tax=Streptomyces sp. NPDC053048 TaxID=3365694 RepID=UPI0037D84CF2
MSTENEGAARPADAGQDKAAPSEGASPQAPAADQTAQLPAVPAEPPVAPPAPQAAAPEVTPAAAPEVTPAPAQTPAPGPAVDPHGQAAAQYAQAGRTAQFPAAPLAHQPQSQPSAAFAAPGAPAPGAPGAAPAGWYGGADAPPPYAGAPGGPAAPWGAPVPPKRKRAGGLVAAVVAAALIAGGVGGGVGYWAADKGVGESSTTVSSSGDPKTESRSPGSVADIANKALPSVVTIEAQSNSGEGGTGTGFVYDKQGHILTNNHVVASAAESGKLAVTFSDGKSYDAEVVGRAQGYDVAVIKLKDPSGAKLNPLPLGNSDRTAVGDATVAIGAPFGLSGTVTTGIVSAKKRPVASSDGGGNGKASYMSALQTDASINPGNSGGPLLNAQGAVIGVNSAIQSAGGGGGGFGGGQSQSGSIGLGFAIPINQAKNVAEQLIKFRTPVYPVIQATVNMKDSGSGARIDGSGSDAVTPGGPADKAGLKAGDVITKLDDTKIDSGPTLISEIWTHRPGDKVTVTYIRDGKTATAQIVLGERRGDNG